jgi:PAS domain S-box-containing protein
MKDQNKTKKQLIDELMELRKRNVRTQSIIQGITEPKQVEENLGKEQEELKLIIDSSPIIVFYRDKEGRFIRVNKTFSEALKMPEEDIVGKTVFNLYSPEIARGMTDDDHEVLKSGRPKLNIIERYESAGGIRWVQTDKVPIFDKNGISVGLIGFAQDITERKQAEAVLRTEKQKFETLSENAPFGVVMIDQDSTFQYINPKFRELFGYDLEDVPNGKTWFRKAFPDPQYRHEVISTWVRDLESIKPGEKRSRIFTVTCKDGTEKIINFIPVQLGTGENLVGYEDITERKRAEEELQKSEEEAKRLAQENAIMAEIGRIISSTLDIEEVYERFAEEVHKIIPFDRIVINVIDIEKGTVINVYMAGKGITDRKGGVIYPLEGSGNAEMVRKKSSLLIQAEDFNGYKERFPMLLSTFKAGFRSIMNVPLFSKGQIIGGLLLRSLKPNAYTDKDVRLAERVGDQIAGAIVNAQFFIERKRVGEERERLILQLQEALAKVKQLSGFLPICASCKKIRDDKGYWNQIESYIRDHSEAEFSHGICPDCMKKLYPDFVD